MFRELKIGAQTVPMVANGATSIRYRMVFGKDIISEMQGAEADNSKVIPAISELAFIMAMAAKAQNGEADMNLLNYDQYVTWLEAFGPMDLTMASDDIIRLYMGNGETKSKSKKNTRDKQNES